jgi:NADH dehydrogenase [ubiquinone] 1 alpha subcomplex assembly factor 5
MTAAAPAIFDPKRRSAMRSRALAIGASQSFLLDHMATELSERLALVSRRFEKALIMGPLAVFANRIFDGTDTVTVADAAVDEEMLPYPPASFDLILSAGTLDSVNDLPGALVQIRRTLQPDGLFLGTLFGSGSLASLKSAMLAADGAQARPHIHPQIDLRSMSDLIMRAGFALPVADSDMLEVRYRNWRRLVQDLREAGVGNALVGPRPISRHLPEGITAAWEQMAAGDGKVRERFNFLQLSGWAPSPSQARPAARGSGAVSLVDALKKS